MLQIQQFLSYWFKIPLLFFTSPYPVISLYFLLVIQTFFFFLLRSFCEVIINPLILWCHFNQAYSDSKKKIISVYYYYFFCQLFERGCSASWLNCARVRNLFQFKQEALIAEAQSQITSIHSVEVL